MNKCAKCGVELQEREKFCHNCGYSFIGENKQSVMENKVKEIEKNTTCLNNNKKNKKSLIIIIIVVIFLVSALITSLIIVNNSNNNKENETENNTLEENKTSNDNKKDNGDKINREKYISAKYQYKSDSTHPNTNCYPYTSLYLKEDGTAYYEDTSCYAGDSFLGKYKIDGKKIVFEIKAYGKFDGAKEFYGGYKIDSSNSYDSSDPTTQNTITYEIIDDNNIKVIDGYNLENVIMTKF